MIGVYCSDCSQQSAQQTTNANRVSALVNIGRQSCAQLAIINSFIANARARSGGGGGGSGGVRHLAAILPPQFASALQPSSPPPLPSSRLLIRKKRADDMAKANRAKATATNCIDARARARLRTRTPGHGGDDDGALSNCRIASSGDANRHSHTQKKRRDAARAGAIKPRATEAWGASSLRCA